MARVVLVQYWIVDHLGLMSISSVLKAGGHESTILVRYEERDILKSIKELKADIVGFSCSTGAHVHALKDVKVIKESMPWVVTIMGGPHATFVPEVIYNDGIDVVCRGEGENALLELADHVKNKTDYSHVSNLWVKSGEKIFKNEVAPLIENIDELPFGDRSHYNRYPILRDKKERAIMFGRGCPHDCTFCFNSSLKDMYKGKGRYIRRRSIENVIKELEGLKKKYFVQQISFEDDTFLDDKDWILEFLKEYKTKINIPYRCNTRFDTLTDDVVLMLKSTGCFLIALGVESGSERIREQVFNKGLKTRDILTGVNILKKYGLKFHALNIIGSPQETLDEAIDTLMINRQIKPDIPFVSLFQPYPATAIVRKYHLIYDYDRLPSSFWSSSVIKQDNIRELENLQRLFYVLLKIPLPRSTIKFIARCHIFRYLYKIIFKVCLLYYTSKYYTSERYDSKTNSVSFFKMLHYAWRHRKVY